MATETRGYTATKDQLKSRLPRVEGQVRGIERMVTRTATASTCSPRSARCRPRLDKVALGLLDDHARHCVIGGEPEKQADRTEELMAAIGRLMRRG